MIFIGFAFLMTFLKKYGFSATGFNLFLGALAIQWAILMRGFFAMEDGSIKWVYNWNVPELIFKIMSFHLRLSLDNLIGADIAAATVLISMGALLGRTTPIQLLVMAMFEIALFAANEHFQLEMMRVRSFHFI
jgi:ammonium transporter Rh